MLGAVAMTTEDELRACREELQRTRMMQGYHEVIGARTAVANAFIQGVGIEVGAGNRPFPVPEGVSVLYGDVRDADALTKHFNDRDVSFGEFIDAQTFNGVPDASLDFIISAHVIEHLVNPFGSIRSGLRCLKQHGTYLLVVPDKRYTFDRDRPETTLEHLLSDLETGGEDTLLDSYREHCRFVHPLSQPVIPEEMIDRHAIRGMQARADIHVHCWTKETFSEHLRHLAPMLGFYNPFRTSVRNEAIFIIRKV
jgi:SAM-dependent methyltransferase